MAIHSDRPAEPDSLRVAMTQLEDNLPLPITTRPGRHVVAECSTHCVVELRTHDDGVVVAPGGAFDGVGLAYLRERLVEALKDYPPCLRIDLTEVHVLDAPGVGLLVMVSKRVRGYGGLFSMTCGHTKTRACSRAKV